MSGRSWVIKYLALRLIRIFLSMIVVSILTFALLQAAPGNFADIQRVTSGATSIGSGQGQETAGQLESRYGSDVPAWKQYLVFMRGAVYGDFGPSYKYSDRNVEDIISTAFPVSAVLAFMSVGLAVLVGVPVGVLAAVRQNSLLDQGTMFFATLGRSQPSYLIAIFLILFFSKVLGLLPTGGWNRPEQAILPVLALALGSIAVIARYVRSSMLETLHQEYIVAAYAKGGSTWIVTTKHALRNSLVPLVTVLGPLLAALMTGTVFIETIFNIPGLGLYFADSARSRDMPLLMGTTLFFAFILMTMNLFVDLLYGVLDPRIRSQQKRAV